MKHTHLFIIVSLLILLAIIISCSNPPRSEWEVLNQEVDDFLQALELDSAYIVAKKALEVAETDVGPDHSNLIYSLNTVAQLSRYQLTDPPPDKPYAIYTPTEEAELLFLRALDVTEEVKGFDHPDVAGCLYNLGSVWITQRRRAEVVSLYERALAIYEKANGPDHPSVASALFALAGLHRWQNHYEQAEPLFQRALSIREDNFKPDDSIVTASLGGLGWNYSKQGKYAQAEPLLKRVLENKEKTLDAGDYRVAQSMSGLAYNYLKQGKYAEAEPLYERSVLLWEKKEGPEDNRVAKELTRLADLYRIWGKYEKAELSYKRAMAIYDKMWKNHKGDKYMLVEFKKSWAKEGRGDPDVATTLHNLAELYRVQGQLKKAEPFYERAVWIWEHNHLPFGYHISICLKNLAQLYRASDRNKEADSLEQRAITIRGSADSLLINYYDLDVEPLLK